MCIIIDANVASSVFSDTPPAGAKPVLDWIDSRGGRLVYGGKLARELERVETARRWLAQQLRAGKARRFSDESLATTLVAVEPACRSNDAHIIALAKVSGARLLYSEDNDLHKDFCDSSLINTPRGKVYRGRPSHRRLLRSDMCSTSN